ALGALAVAVMIGLRYHVGGDWEPYAQMFEDASWLDLREALTVGDPAYSALNWLVNALGLRIWAVNLVCGAIFAWGLVRFCAQQPNPWLAALAAIPYLVIVVAMGYSRQGVAIGIILAGLSRLEQGKLWAFTLYVIPAVLFHKSAIVVLPIAALSVRQSRLVTLLIMLLFGIMLYYLFIQSSIDRLVTNYIDAQYDSGGAAVRIAMNIPPALLFLLLQRRIAAGDEQQRKLWRNFSIAACAAMVLLFVISSSTAVDRMALYLIPLQLYVLSRLPDAIGRGRTSGLVLAGVILYSAAVQFVWLNYARHAELWVPYRVYPIGSDDPTI
ncbi:MAG: EpsG family protein, partial [Allosphingosinicella sp.]